MIDYNSFEKMFLQGMSAVLSGESDFVAIDTEKGKVYNVEPNTDTELPGYDEWADEHVSITEEQVTEMAAEAEQGLKVEYIHKQGWSIVDRAEDIILEAGFYTEEDAINYLIENGEALERKAVRFSHAIHDAWEE